MLAWQKTLHESVLMMQSSGGSRRASTKVFLLEDFLSVEIKVLVRDGTRRPKRITDFLGLLSYWRGMAIAPEHLLSRTEARRDVGPSSSVRTSGTTQGKRCHGTWKTCGFARTEGVLLR